METNKLYSLAEDTGISVDFLNIPAAKAMVLELYGKTYLAIDKAVRSGSAEERVLLAHELGHIETNSYYKIASSLSLREFCEKKAERWAINALVPLDALVDAYRNGNETVSSLAEIFGVTEEFMGKALEFYSTKSYSK